MVDRYTVLDAVERDWEGEAGGVAHRLHSGGCDAQACARESAAIDYTISATSVERSGLLFERGWFR